MRAYEILVVWTDGDTGGFLAGAYHFRDQGVLLSGARPRVAKDAPLRALFIPFANAYSISIGEKSDEHIG